MATIKLDPLLVAKYQNTLPNLLTPGLFIDARSGGNYAITMSQGLHNFGLGGAFVSTDAWGYHNSTSAPLWDNLGLNYLGPTIVAKKDVSFSVNWDNQLPVEHLLDADMTMHGAHESLMGGVKVQPHVHGGLTVASSDGNPFATDAFLGTETYTYRNAQSALTSWYHDHALGITRLNVYAGLAGFYIIRDNKDTGVGDNPNTPADDNPLDLPSNYFGVDYNGNPGLDPDAAYEFPIVIQDKTFDSSGKLYYPAIPGDPLAGPGNRTVPPVPGINPVTGLLNPFPGAPTSPTMVPEYGGDVMIVNGVAWPKLDVEARTYRFRLLNGSDSRFYELKLPSGLNFQVIGSDNGLLDGPAVPVRTLRMAPGERYDVIIDFSKQAGKTLTLSNVAGGQGSRPIFNDPQTTGQIMQFNVKKGAPSIPDPVSPQWKIDLRPNETLPVWAKNANGTWTSSVGTTTLPGAHALSVFEGLDPYGRIFPHLGTVNEGSLLWEDPDGEVRAKDAETVKADQYTLFEIYNTTPDAHPIHLHGTEFQILERQNFKATLQLKNLDLITEGGMMMMPAQGASFVDTNKNGSVYDDITLFGSPKPVAPYERGFKDTAIVDPGERILVVAKYDSALLNPANETDSAAAGKYVWHCHILSHEDHEMMRPLQVLA
jgi:spore coat protein A